MPRKPDAAFIERCTKLHDTIENATKEQVAQLVLDAKQFNISEAESMYRRALTFAERLPDGYDRTVLLKLGGIYCEQGRYEEAEKLLRRCWSKADHDDTDVAEALGTVLRRTGREKEAEEIEEPARRLRWFLNP